MPSIFHPLRTLTPLVLLASVAPLAAISGAADAPPPAPAVLIAGYVRNYHATSEELHALADVTRALGEYDLKRQEAERQRIENRYKKLDLHKAELEHWVWVREFRDLDGLRRLQEEKDRGVIRSLRYPTQTEILSGTAINALVEVLANQSQAQPNGSVRIDVRWLPDINIGSGAAGNFGLLKKQPLPWPIMLQRSDLFAPQCDGLEKLLESIRIQAASKGKVNPSDWESLAWRVVYLQEGLTSVNKKAGAAHPVWTLSVQMQSRRFLDDLRAVVSAISTNPESLAEYLAPIQGETIAEVVQHLTSRSMKIAPATVGSERAYVALHGALVKEMERLGLDQKFPLAPRKP